MKKLLSIYKNIKIKRVTYEKGDETVMLECCLIFDTHEIDTTLIITHSDFNRLLSKIILNGYDIDTNTVNTINFGDGTEIVEYSFKNTVEIDKFNFNYHVKQISA
ncbi:MAG TPA: hypothetical protein EYG85_01205 [Crocinitomix sp.]|nr:hypothetical protein [Crocinitomix sp.]